MHGVKIKFISLLLILFSKIGFSLDNDTTRKPINLVIKTDLILSYVNTINVVKRNADNWNHFSYTIEQMFKNNHSIQVTTYGARFPWLLRGKWYVIAPEYKYYVSKKRKYTGYYVGGGFKYIGVTDYSNGNWVPPQTLNDPSIPVTPIRKSNAIGVGFINGVQFYLAKRIAIDFILGIGVNTNLKHYRNYAYALNGKSDVRAAINIGFRF
jgi:hypothetical protein